MAVGEKREHAKFLLYQVQQEVELGAWQGRRDCVVQCSDGSCPAPGLVLAALSPALAALLTQTWQHSDIVLVAPLEVGQLLLFFKYLYSIYTEEMFNKEDVEVIQAVCDILGVDSSMFTSGHNVGSNHAEETKAQKVKESRLIETCGNEEVPELNENHSSDAGCRSNLQADRKRYRMRRLKQQEKLKSTVKCKYCDSKISFSLISKHIKQRHLEYEHCCLVCGHRNRSRAELESHVQEHSEDSAWYLNCERCGQVCLSQYQLQLHKRGHNIKQLGSMQCPHCPRLFQVAQKFNTHLASHQSGKLDKSLACVHCNKTFQKQYDLARHLKSHMGIKPYTCDTCGLRFVDGTRLKQHKWIHLDLKAFKCSHENCDEIFRHKSHLKSHIASFHPDTDKDSMLACHLCKRKFAFQYKLARHLEWHAMDMTDGVEHDSQEFNITNMHIIDQIPEENLATEVTPTSEEVTQSSDHDNIVYKIM